MQASPEHQPEMVTLFEAYCGGDRDASDRLFELVHDDLRSLADAIFRNARPNHTLQATAIVNEAWLRMAAGVTRVNDRHHFFAIAARAMRHVLADHAKARGTHKRGGDRMRISFDESELIGGGGELDLFMFNDALEQLSILDERAGRIAELRVLGTLTFPEIADVLELGERTVKRDWQVARLWLLKELQ